MRTASSELKERAIALFHTGITADAVGLQVGYSGAAVRKWLRACGIDPMRRQPSLVAPTDMSGAPKICTVCEQTYPATEEYFYKRKRRGQHELTPTCRSCTKGGIYKNRAENLEAVREQVRRSYNKNKDTYNAQRREKRSNLTEAEQEALRDANRRWIQDNKEWLVNYRIGYLQKNKEVVQERGRQYYRRTLARQQAYRRAYKARRKGAEGWFTLADVLQQLDRQEAGCFWCGGSLVGGYHADHYIPLNKGGSNWPDNIVLACQTCNLSRGDKSPEEFRAFLLLAAPAWMMYRLRRPPTEEEKAAMRAYVAAAQRKSRGRKKARLQGVLPLIEKVRPE